MNLNELLNSTITEKVDAKKYLYHVTFTKNVPNIKKKGLIQFQPSNWIKGPGGDRYNNDIAGIFAFDHPEDALNWAGKMEYEFRDTDKNISIVRIDMEDFWEDDPAEDPFVSNKGKAKYSPRDIKADKIIDVLDMSGIKRPGDLGISRDEWLADVSKKLTELHGGGGIPDYTTMPAYGLKRASKGKHKFFVPKGEKLPAGVGAIKENKHNWKEIENRLSRHPGITGGIIGSQEAKDSVDAWIKVLKVGEEQMDFFDAELPKALPLVIRMMELEALKHPKMFGWFQDDDTIGQIGDLEPYEDLPGFIKTIANKIGIIEIPDDEANYFGAIKEEMAGEEKYHDYTIKYILAPNAQGIYRGIIHPPKNLKDTLEAKRLEATSIDELIHSAKEWIESGFSPSRSWSEVPTDASITLDLNSSFMLDSLGVNAVHYIKLSQINGRPVLLVAPDDAIENYGSNEVEKKQGYKKTATKSLGTSSSFMSKAKAKEIGLKPNGRYTLEKSNKKTDNMGSDIYSMVFNSIVSPTKEQKRLSVPAVTIAVNRSTKRSVPLEGLTEATQKYYHGSYDKLENGTILTPGGDDYEASWGGTSFYGPLEKFRPPEKLAHKEGVFMVGDIDDVDVAGGATEYIYIVEPIGDVQKHDLNWGSEISGLMDNGKKPNDKEVKQAADNYWNGVPHHNEQVWEYLAPRAKIVSVLDEAWKVKVPTKKKRKMSKQDKDWSMLRTALESDLFEAGTGDCFEVANRAMIGMTEEQEVYGMKCIHAYVYGQGDLKGRRFPHAWNEQGDVVFDNSNGNNIVMRKEQYYALGGVVQESGAYATYDKDDCLIKMLKYSHYGPWDLNDSLDENIPDEAKEIGKEKSRIPRNLLNTIKNELDLEAQVESAWEEFKSNVE